MDDRGRLVLPAEVRRRLGLRAGDEVSMSVEAEGAAALDLLIAPLGEPALRQSALMAREFRRAGLSVELAEGKLKRVMELANKLGARFALIVGEDEMAAGRYALKNMSTGAQESLTREEIAVRLAAPADHHAPPHNAA